MKAALFTAPGQITITDVPKPDAGPGEVLIKVQACAVCGTDVKIFGHGHPKLKPPRVLGHELAGTIAEIGNGVAGYEVGDRVCIVTVVGCRQCDLCRQEKFNICPDLKAVGYDFDGGFAEYILMDSTAVDQGNILKIPPELSFEEATLVEPLSCVINGQSYLNIVPGDTVIVIGAGPIGSLHCELAKLRGATKILLADVASSRLEIAQRMNIDILVDSSKEDLVERVMKETGGCGADVVITACGVGQAQENAIEMAAKQARISLFGGLPKDKPNIKFNSNLVHYREISVHGVFASNSFQYIQAIHLLAAKRVQACRFITHRFDLDDVIKGIEAARSGETLKVIIKP